MNWMWTWGGKCFGYLDGANLWTHDGKHIGRLVNDEIYGADGYYLEEVRNGNKLTSHIPHLFITHFNLLLL